jgi:hypothetical protein
VEAKVVFPMTTTTLPLSPRAEMIRLAAASAMKSVSMSGA